MSQCVSLSLCVCVCVCVRACMSCPSVHVPVCVCVPLVSEEDQGVNCPSNTEGVEQVGQVSHGLQRQHTPGLHIIRLGASAYTCVCACICVWVCEFVCMPVYVLYMCM